jgi:hypothetical protein
MYGKGAGRQRPGQPISARFLNRTAMLAEAGAGLTVGPGLTYQTVNGRPLVRALPGAAGTAEVRLAITTAGIAEPTWDGTTLSIGYGPITFLDDDSPNWVLGTETDTAYHVIPGGGNVDSGSIVVVSLADNRWVIIAASCSAGVNTAAIAAPSNGNSGSDTDGNSGVQDILDIIETGTQDFLDMFGIDYLGSGTSGDGNDGGGTQFN